MSSPAPEAAARKARARIAGALMALPGVHGVAVGRKQRGGVADGEPCVVVFVDKKRPLHELPDDERIPGVVPDTAITTDVVEYPRVFAQAARAYDLAPAPALAPASARSVGSTSSSASTMAAASAASGARPRPVTDIAELADEADEADASRHEPLMGGAQIQSYAHRGAVGTLGAVLYDTRHRRLVGLGSWHALHRWPSPGSPGDAIYQPSFCARNQIGAAIAGCADGTVDAAIFSVDGRAASRQIRDIGAWSGKLDDVSLGLEVMKRGRTTRLTRGTVKYLDATLQVSHGGDRAITYTGLIGVEPKSPFRQFSAPGDSGSVVVDTAGRRLVSLHFAGNAVDGWGCPIAAVEQALDIRVSPDPTDTGAFHTDEVRPWRAPEHEHRKPVAFARPHAAPPAIAMGLSEIDAGNAADLRISAAAIDVTAAGFTASLDSRADTVLYRAASAWHAIAPGDPDVQTGAFHTRDDAPRHRPMPATMRRIRFDRRYAAPPAVIVWLHELHIASRANARVWATAHDVDETGFTLRIDTWADTALHAAGVTWIAHPADLPGVASGTFHTQDVRPWNQPRQVTSGSASFPAGRFTAAPRVLVALNALDVDRQANLRVRASVSSVTAAGMTWSLDSWADTRLYSAGASYLAIGAR